MKKSPKRQLSSVFYLLRGNKKKSAISTIERPTSVKILRPLLIKISISHHLDVLDA